jgi:hypothetical protein
MTGTKQLAQCPVIAPANNSFRAAGGNALVYFYTPSTSYILFFLRVQAAYDLRRLGDTRAAGLAI